MSSIDSGGDEMNSNSVLVINCGSSSIKYQLLQPQSGQIWIAGEVERIGMADTLWRHEQADVDQQIIPAVGIVDHRSALELINQLIIKALAKNRKLPLADNLLAIAHRVVHGGEYFTSATQIDERVKARIRELIPLAPMHNPVNLLGIEVAETFFPGVVQVAVFDTAFHQSLPEYAFRYALPEAVYSEFNLRRYGFHGTSHAYVLRKTAEYFEQRPETLNVISIHLGNGASMAAIKNGRCIDTTMGFTPLEGLMMGTRCGDMDPSIAIFLVQNSKKNPAEILKMLNEQSGLKGICGYTDMRDVKQQADAGDASAVLARQMFCYRIKKYIGAYRAVLGRVDAIVFTGGIGEHDQEVRQQSCEGLEELGIVLDQAQQADQVNTDQAVMALDDSLQSKIQVLLIPANEEWEIAMQALISLK